MEKLQFKAKGSGLELYTINIKRKDSGQITITCNCMASFKGLHCKHRIKILSGDYSLQPNTKATKEKAKTLESWLVNSELKKSLDYYFVCEESFQSLKSALDKSKKDLIKIMEGK
ncbi:MAG: hypothetical protein ACTH58_04800 [Marinomonas foliarum]|uniref:hypothetical protein n=1 Tax=Marinomonas foliarum TaxID=491950 RepID=UPI003F9D05A4